VSYFFLKISMQVQQYRVAYNNVVLLNSRIQTERNNVLKEQ